MPLTSAQREQVVYTVMLVTVLGVIGIVVIMLLLGTWRRFNERNAAARRDAARGRIPSSPWQVAGERANEREENEGDKDTDQGDENAGRG